MFAGFAFQFGLSIATTALFHLRALARTMPLAPSSQELSSASHVYTVRLEAFHTDQSDDAAPFYTGVQGTFLTLEQANAFARQCVLFASRSDEFIPTSSAIAEGEKATAGICYDAEYAFCSRFRITRTETRYLDGGCIEYCAWFQAARNDSRHSTDRRPARPRQVIAHVRRNKLSSTTTTLTPETLANWTRYMPPGTARSGYLKRKISEISTSPPKHAFVEPERDAKRQYIQEIETANARVKEIENNRMEIFDKFADYKDLVIKDRNTLLSRLKQEQDEHKEEVEKLQLLVGQTEDMKEASRTLRAEFQDRETVLKAQIADLKKELDMARTNKAEPTEQNTLLGLDSQPSPEGPVKAEISCPALNAPSLDRESDLAKSALHSVHDISLAFLNNLRSYETNLEQLLRREEEWKMRQAYFDERIENMRQTETRFAEQKCEFLELRQSLAVEKDAFERNRLESEAVYRMMAADLEEKTVDIALRSRRFEEEKELFNKEKKVFEDRKKSFDLSMEQFKKREEDARVSLEALEEGRSII
ncbi:hypothetical protein BJ508DRAFT_362085 [Ascobolus immersus RN42]|uniref:Uncharacterized protein n=1 Tax=Ascobolus immersus RN42 TaxID=1160509 RepID=A0A3N4I5E5_ASCIM|nr:hypothetical protein BJ508DRAFT_362085 [Ascobolus immersus RN42]